MSKLDKEIKANGLLLKKLLLNTPYPESVGDTYKANLRKAFAERDRLQKELKELKNEPQRPPEED